MTKTEIIILGAQKCATTSLFDVMTRAPRIVGASPKEPHYFSTCEDWRDGLDDYHRIYAAQDDALRLEASTTYTFFPHRKRGLWHDLHAYNPTLRLIYVVRKPVDRIMSHYKHVVRRGYFSGTLEKFALNKPQALSISRYYTQIRPFIERFGREQVLLLQYEDVISGRANRKVAEFVGLDPDALGSEPALSNESGAVRHRRFSEDRPAWKLLSAASPKTAERISRRLTRSPPASPDLSPELQGAINHMLEPDIRAFEKLSGFDLGHWRCVTMPQAARTG